MGTLTGLSTNIGALLALMIGLPQIFGTNNLWPYGYYVEMIPCLMLVCYAIFFLHESPFYYLKRMDENAAKKVIQFYGPKNDCQINEQIENFKIQQRNESEVKEINWMKLCHDRATGKALFLSVLLNCTVSFSGIMAMTFFGTALLSSAGFTTTDASLANCFAGLAGTIGILIQAITIDKIGRRFLLLGSLISLTMIPVDAIEFIDSAKEYFPDATLSIGWTKNNLSELTIPQMNIGWRELFHVLALVKEIDQPLVLTIRLSTAAYSIKQVEFILGIRPTISALIWSDEMDSIKDWYEIINLRSGVYSKRLVFDLHAKHRNILKMLPYSIVMSESEFNRSHWNLIEFPSVFAQSSGAIVSDEGVAFLGWPTAFLISLMQPLVFPDIQRITAKLIFVKKKQNINDDWLKHSGFVIYLLEKVLDLQSPEITTGIKIFIGYNGRLSIENRGKQHNYYNMKAAGQARHDQNCYDVELIDRGWQVELTVGGNNCQDGMLKNPTKITLEISLTKTRQLRNVIVSKTGDGNLDLIVRDLKHSSSNRPQLYLYCLFAMFSIARTFT
ncbi:unnamed protein product [Acanthocheilonema viteae]|uniref:Major facilitator superfamily (MFS) profile domain-containing protein n=1 Tax=Acanthocheilonema viteae TaxID=6277 RepID=A0A498SGP2_ACAVI|nr:unnamed protein product [Acanthocheilonema viteae]